MSKKQNNIPELRFPEFDNEWNQTQIENHFVFKNGLNKEKEYFGRGTPIINFMDVYKLNSIKFNDIKGLVKLNEVEIERFSALKGDVFFTRTSETIKDIGMSATLIEEIPNSVFSGFVLRARPLKKTFYPLFTSFLFNTEQVRKEIVTKSSMTTRALTSGTLLNKVYFKFPPSLIEQQKIAAFLNSVDKRIQALEQKKELLEQYKKGVMQKIFSRVIRFQPGSVTHHLPIAAEPTTVYNNNNAYPDWEVKKLGDIATITTGSSNREDSSLVGEYTFFDRSQDIRTSDRYLFDKEAIIFPGEGQKFVPKYFIGKFDLHQRAYAIFDFKGTDGLYLYYLLSFSDRHLQAQAVGSTVKSLRLPMFKSMPINLPCLEEQQKIAGFLSAIDTKIEAVTSQIDHSKTFKKGLLQKMFV